jgi:5-methylcytosine-specific restriction endonuclease McrA
MVASRTDQEMAINRMMTEYRGAAREFGRVFDLTTEEFSALVLADCHYCGTAPFSGFAPRSSRRRKVLLNGIDRVDSAKGYRRDNVVTCCKHCNKAKLDRTEEEFVEHCRRVVAHHERRANARAQGA